MQPNPQKPGSRRGRRPDRQGESVRRQLLDAARRLFALKGFKAVSLKALADEAGTTPAMVPYYFGGKKGLYEAMLDDSLTPLLEELQRLAETADSNNVLETFIGAHMRLIAANPWLPPLILREVIAEGGRFREYFIRQFASRGGGLLSGLVQREQEAGRFRSDLDPVFTALSMVSMSVFPFVALPLTSSVFGVRLKDEVLDALIANTQKLFLQGAKT